MIFVIIKDIKGYLETFITKKMTIDDAEHIQDEFNSMLGVLSNYGPKAQKYIEAKSKLLDNAKNFYEGREKFIEVFKNGILPLNHNNEFKEEQQTNKEFNKKEPPIKPTKIDANELNKFIIKKERDINKELFKKIFNFQMLTEMLKTLYDINDKNKNNQFVK